MQNGYAITPAIGRKVPISLYVLRYCLSIFQLSSWRKNYLHESYVIGAEKLWFCCYCCCLTDFRMI